MHIAMELGGIILSKVKACNSTEFLFAWPDYIKEFFHKGNITNSDLEMSVLFSQISMVL